MAENFLQRCLGGTCAALRTALSSAHSRPTTHSRPTKRPTAQHLQSPTTAPLTAVWLDPILHLLAPLLFTCRTQMAEGTLRTIATTFGVQECTWFAISLEVSLRSKCWNCGHPDHGIGKSIRKPQHRSCRWPRHGRWQPSCCRCGCRLCSCRDRCHHCVTCRCHFLRFQARWKTNWT